MTCPTLLPLIVETLRIAGDTDEIIADAVKAGEEFQNAPRRRRGRRRLYSDRALRDRAYHERKKARDEIRKFARDEIRDRRRSRPREYNARGTFASAALFLNCSTSSLP
jgi:hypothetical protein